jgi:hypothetical protein
MTNENDPHDREYSGAVAGMAETYGRLEACNLPSVGDRIAYRLKTHTDTEWEAGRVVRIQEAGDRPLVVVEAEDEKTLRVIDGRPWPTGSILPF